jgi:hypothetical protein
MLPCLLRRTAQTSTCAARRAPRAPASGLACRLAALRVETDRPGRRGASSRLAAAPGGVRARVRTRRVSFSRTAGRQQPARRPPR